jgi:hypothetical protein
VSDCNGTKALVGAREFRHYIGGQREQRDKDEDIPLLDYTKRSKDVRLTGTRLLHYGKVIETHEMQKTRYSVNLRRIHLLNTPNGQQSSNNTRLQAIVVAPGHCNNPRCVCCRPIIKSDVRDMGERVDVVPVERGVLGNLMGDTIG